MRCWQNLPEQPEVELPVWNTTSDLWPLHSSAKVSICRSQAAKTQHKHMCMLSILYVYHANIVTISLTLDHTYFLMQASCNIHSLKHNTNLSIIAMKAIWFPMWTPGGLFPFSLHAEMRTMCRCSPCQTSGWWCWRSPSPTCPLTPCTLRRMAMTLMPLSCLSPFQTLCPMPAQGSHHRYIL